MGGIKYKVSRSWDVKLDLAYNTADASMDSFRFLEGELWALPRAVQNFEFAQTYTYSDLDTERWEFDLGGRYWFKERWWVRAGYRYVDYTDNAPYLYDTSGTIDYWNIGLGMAF